MQRPVLLFPLRGITNCGLKTIYWFVSTGCAETLMSRRTRAEDGWRADLSSEVYSAPSWHSSSSNSLPGVHYIPAELLCLDTFETGMNTVVPRAFWHRVTSKRGEVVAAYLIKHYFHENVIVIVDNSSSSNITISFSY